MKHPTMSMTRGEIDTEIMRTRRIISSIEDEGGDPLLIEMFAADIVALRSLRESVARPWEKDRPSDEVGLERFGVTV